MKTLIKILTNGRVISAVVSALGAIISATCAGCRLYCAELSVKDIEAEIFNQFHSSTNNTIKVI